MAKIVKHKVEFDQKNKIESLDYFGITISFTNNEVCYYSTTLKEKKRLCDLLNYTIDSEEGKKINHLLFETLLDRSVYVNMKHVTSITFEDELDEPGTYIVNFPEPFNEEEEDDPSEDNLPSIILLLKSNYKESNIYREWTDQNLNLFHLEAQEQLPMRQFLYLYDGADGYEIYFPMKDVLLLEAANYLLYIKDEE